MLARFAFLLGVLLAPSVSAQPYLGASTGQAQYSGACDGAPPGITCASGDIGFRLFGGYSFTPHFAVELGAGMLGAASASSGESMDLSAIDLSAIGSWPISNRFSAHARLGVYAGHMGSLTETDDTVPAVAVPCPGAPPGVFLPPCPPPPPPRRGWQAGSNTDVTYGLGLSYAMSDTGSLRFEWQRFQNLGGSGGPKLDVDLFSLGVLFHLQ